MGGLNGVESRTWPALLAAVLLVAGPVMIAVLPSTLGAPTPLAVASKTAFFDDFETGALDSEKWQLPTSFAVERARLRPWATPTLPLNDSALYHLSDTAYPAPAAYANSSHAALETTWIDLTEATAGAQLRLYHRYDIDAAEDAAIVFVRSESRGWAVIAPEGGYPTANGFSGFSSAWELTTFDLSLFGGSRVKLALQVQAGDNGAVGDGWHIDSATVTFSTTVPSPDLRVTEVAVYSSAGSRITTGTAGDVLDLRVDVTNVGSAATTSAVPVFFFDGTPSAGRFLGQGLLSSVSASATAAASVRAVLTAGAHNLSAVVDPGRILNELSTANNEARSALTLNAGAGVDLALLAVTYEVGGTRTSGARPGQLVVANFTVANLGSVDLPGVFAYGVYLDTPNQTKLAEETRSGLASGEARVVNVTFSAIEGDLPLLAAIDLPGGVNESNEANNEARQVFAVTGVPPADLTVDSVIITFQSVPTNEVAEGDLLGLRAVVRNRGTGTIPGAFVVGLFLGDPDAGGKALFARTVPGGLGANATVEVRGTWAASVGQRTLYAYTDLGREVFEADELNNKAYGSVHVQPDGRANLVIDAVRFKVLGEEVNSTRIGAPVAVEVTVRNLGANGSVSGQLSMSPQNPWVSPLAPGVVATPLPSQLARNTVAVLSFPWTAQAGVKVFFLTVDQTLSTGELSEFDNVAVRTLTVSAESPDLLVSAVSVKSRGAETSTLYPGLNVTVSAEVTNAGVSEVDVAFDLEIWAGEPGTFGAVRIVSRTFDPPFAAGESLRVTVQWFASFPVSGAARIVAVADPAQEVIEAERANNIADKDITYLGAQRPNLQVERFAVARAGLEVGDATAGEPLTLEITVKNDSPAPYLGGGVLEVHDGAALIYTAPLGRIEPRETVSFAVNWTAQMDAHLVLVLDSLQAVEETSEEDNAQVAVVRVTAAATTPWGLYLGLAAAAGAAGAAALMVAKRRKTSKAPAPLAPTARPGAPPTRPMAPQRPMPPGGYPRPPPGAPPYRPGSPYPPPMRPGTPPPPGAPRPQRGAPYPPPPRRQSAPPPPGTTGAALAAQGSSAEARATVTAGPGLGAPAAAPAPPGPTPPARDLHAQTASADAAAGEVAGHEQAPPAAAPVCPKCNQEVDPAWVLCPNCEAPLGSSSV